MSEKDVLFGEIRGLLSAPSSKNFKVITSKLIDSTLEPQVLTEEFIPYILEKLEGWPEHAWRRLDDEMIKGATGACERGVPLYQIVYPIDVRLLGEEFLGAYQFSEYGMGFNDIAGMCDVLEQKYGIKPRHIEIDGSQFTSFFPCIKDQYRQKYYYHHGNIKIQGGWPHMNWSTFVTITGDLEFEQDASIGEVQLGVGGDLIARNLSVDAAMQVSGTIKVHHAMLNDYDAMLYGNVLKADVGMWWNAILKDTSEVKLAIEFDNAPPCVLPKHMKAMKTLLKPELIAQMYAYAIAQGAEPGKELGEMYPWLRDELPRIMNDDPDAIWM